MNDIFDDPQDVHMALAELHRLKQNKLPATEFFTKFEGLMHCASLNEVHHSEVLIGILELNLNRPLVDHIYSNDVLPVGYMAWKRKAMDINQLY
jgi:hypothetical protein